MSDSVWCRARKPPLRCTLRMGHDGPHRCECCGEEWAGEVHASFRDEFEALNQKCAALGGEIDAFWSRWQAHEAATEIRMPNQSKLDQLKKELRAMTTRCKFRVNWAVDHHGFTDLEATPVYSTDPTSENKAFWGATPAGSLKLMVNKTALGHVTIKALKVGTEFYLDITPIEQPMKEPTP
jgi:hypothetical protein